MNPDVPAQTGKDMRPEQGQNMSTVHLYQLAHGRTGDKGDRSNISVIAFRPEFYPAIVEQVTPEVARGVFAHREPGAIARYLLPQLHAVNFVIDAVLDGGVNDSLNLDSHGKALAGFLLDVQLQVPTSWLAGTDTGQLLSGSVTSSTIAGPSRQTTE